MLHRIVGWCKGYVMVRLPDGQAERFINLCKNHGMDWWNIYRDQGSGYVYGCISREDYFRLRPYVQRSRIFPLVINRYGGIFWLQRAGRRASFWCGVLCFLLLLFFLSSRIWGIAVEGQHYHTEESILRFLESDGIYGGMAARDVVCSDVEADIREHFEDVGWAGIEKTGSKIYVRLEEVIPAKEKEKEVPGSIVAEEAGTVYSIVTKKGTAKVRAGDSVRKGKTLISGRLKIIGDNDEVVARKRVQAQGSVVLECTREYRDTLKKEYLHKIYTGRERELYQFSWEKRNLFLYNPLKYLETFEKCDIIREGGRLCPSLSLRFPLSVWKQTARETRYVPDRYSKQEAQDILTERYQYELEKMRQQLCYDISGELKVTETGSGYEARAVITYRKEQKEYRKLGGY